MASVGSLVKTAVSGAAGTICIPSIAICNTGTTCLTCPMPINPDQPANHLVYLQSMIADFAITLSVSPSSDSDFLCGAYSTGPLGASSYAYGAYPGCAAGTLYYTSSVPTTRVTLPNTGALATYDSAFFEPPKINLYSLYETGVISNPIFSLYFMALFRNSITTSDIVSAIGLSGGVCIDQFNPAFSNKILMTLVSPIINFYGGLFNPCNSANLITLGTAAASGLKPLNNQFMSYSPGTLDTTTISSAKDLPLYMKLDFNLGLSNPLISGTRYI